VARAYLRPARGRANLRVLTGARVDRLLLRGDRCTGLLYRRHGRARTAHAAREVILAAGAIGTPKLLLLSGIGPPQAARALGIAVSHALPGVGQGLNEHVNVILSAFVDTPSYNTQRRGWAAMRHGAALLLRGRGPASSPANHCQAFLRTDPALASADAQIQLMAFGFGTRAQMRRDGISAVISLCHPNARGIISLRAADPACKPRIAIALLADPADRATLLAACRHARVMLRRAGARLYAPDDAVQSDADWHAYITRTAGLNWHPTSSCRMGPDPARDVVDATLRVHGLRGLSIADASVMPSITSGNTNAPVIAIAERAAGFIAARADFPHKEA
jgi:choline dehydrogenase